MATGSPNALAGGARNAPPPSSRGAQNPQLPGYLSDAIARAPAQQQSGPAAQQYDQLMRQNEALKRELAGLRGAPGDSAQRGAPSARIPNSPSFLANSQQQ